MTKCPQCDSEHVIKNGKSGSNQKFKCKDCDHNFLDTPEDMEKVAEETVAVEKEIEAASPEATETPEGKFKSQKAKHVWFRAHYKDAFDKPKYSKKYGFEFNSWFEYFVLKYEATKKVKNEANTETK